MRISRSFALSVAVAALAVGCAQVLGLDDYGDGAATAGGGASGGGSSTGGSGGSGGLGGAGGAGGAQALFGLSWAERWGGSASESVAGLALDDADGIAVTGTHQGPFDLDGIPLAHGGDRDVFVAKVDRVGAAVWAYAFGDDAPQQAMAIARKSQSEELTYVTGIFHGAMSVGGSMLSEPSVDYQGFVLRIGDLSGPNSAFQFDGPGLQWPAPIAVAPVSSQNLLLTGYTEGDTYIAGSISGDGMNTGFVSRMYGATSGDDWAFDFGASGEHRGFGIVADGAGNCFVVGEVSGSMDLGGPTHVTASGSPDAFVARFAVGSGATWLRGFGSQGEERATHVALTADGDLIVAGTFTTDFVVDGHVLSPTGGDPDLFVMRLGAMSGDVQWATSLPATGANEPSGLAVEPIRGHIYLGANFTGSLTVADRELTGNQDFFIAVLSPDGEPLDAHAFGDAAGSSPDEQHLSGMELNSGGELVITGNLRGSLDLLGQTLTSAGEEDFFIAVLVPMLVP